MKTIKQFLYLITPFWAQRSALLAWILLILVLTLSLSSVWFNIQMNAWNGGFYNALQKLDGQALYQLLQQFILLVSGLILVVVLADYLKQKLIIRWRQGMTEQILGRWLSPNSKHYMLQLASQEPDNPDQRIAEDVRLLIESSLRLLISFLLSVLTLVSFSAILWSLSGSLSFRLAGNDLTLPGYMFWACLLYTLVGIALTQWIGYPLRQLNMERQRREADFRGALMMRRQSGDAIAGQRGEAHEGQALMTRFRGVVGNWHQLIRYERNLSFFTVGYQQITALAPIFFALPKFLAGELLLGGLMQLRQSFSQVAGALGWFIFAYREIAAWQATVSRLYNFVILLENETLSKVEQRPSEDKIRLQAQLDLFTAEGAPLLQNLDFSADAGSLTLISGRSGIGKSTLLRALSGHWPYYQGRISQQQDLLWIPQRMYLPPATLHNLLVYPQQDQQQDQQISVADCQQALTQVGLEKLIPQLALDADWVNRLSGGEQQRLMIARLLLNKPALLLLDEITSALDDESAVAMITLLKTALPDSAIVLVSHQRALRPLADHRLHLRAPLSLNTQAGSPNYVA